MINFRSIAGRDHWNRFGSLDKRQSGSVDAAREIMLFFL